MLKKLFQSLPFVHHQPPLNIPLRNAIILATRRPVQLDEIGKLITKKLSKNGNEALKDIQNALEYLRKKRMGKKDCGNFLTSSLRSLYAWNEKVAIQFGLDNIETLPDKRAIMSLVTYLNRAGRGEESLALLNKVKRNRVLNQKKNILLKAMYKDRLSEIPFLFELQKPLKLNKKVAYFNCPIERIQEENDGVYDIQLELNGRLTLNQEEKPSAVIAVFEFFDHKNQELEFARINGLTFSENVGWYSYLRHDNESGGFNIFLELDSRVASVQLGFRNWHANSTIFLHPEVDLKLSSINEIGLEFEQFLKDVAYADCEELIFVLSGTTYVQDIRANRPIRLTNYFIRNNIPVIFSYHRWNRNEEIPEYTGNLLFQIPIDITLQMMDRISKIDSINNKMFMISYPHKAIPKILNRFRIKNWKCIYDARDDWEEFQKVGQAKWYNSSNEKYIVRNSDYVTAVSQVLADKLQQFEPIHPVIVNRNALAEEFLSETYKKVKSKQRIVGYFGHLTGSWFDWDRLIEIAGLRPEIKFEIIGHSEPKNLQLPANIILLGPKTHAEINDIAAFWSIGIIPFKIGKLSDAVDPIKIYEYFSLGLPVVSFQMPQIVEYPYTLTVESCEEFADGLDEFIKNPPRSLVLEKWLQKNKWEHRAEEYRRLMTQKTDDHILGLEV